MTSKGKVLYKQHFQNAQKMIEVTVIDKPKAKLLKSSNKKDPNPFKRDCVFKNELENLAKEEEEKKRCKIKEQKMNPERPLPKLKMNQPKVAIEIQKKSKKKKKDKKKSHEFLPPGMSWGEFLKNVSSSRATGSSLSNDNFDTCESDDNTHINQEEIVRKQRKAAEKINFLENKSKSQNKQNKTKHSQQVDKLEEVFSESSQLHSSSANLRSRPTNLCHPTYVSRAIQTSYASLAEAPALDLPDTQKSAPVIKSNKSQNQTHSPFGDSALKLLHQLRERLRSKGDSQGSDIVDALEAFFGTAESRPNENQMDIGKSASPVFPIPIHELKTVVPDFEKNKLERIISQQKVELEEQKKNIQELKSLSKRFIDYHAELWEILNRQSKINEIPGKDLKSCDSGIDLNMSDELKKNLKTLLQENEHLKKVVEEQKKVLVSVELENFKFRKIYELNDENRRPPSAAGNALCNIERSSSKDKGQKCFLPTLNNDNIVSHLLCHTPNESDENVDSAYEEKSFKSGSRPSSNSTVSIRALTEVNPRVFPLNFYLDEKVPSSSYNLSHGHLEEPASNGNIVRVLSESSVNNVPDMFLESTHVNNRKSIHNFDSKGDDSVHRFGFASQDVSSLNESETLIPVTEL